MNVGLTYDLRLMLGFKDTYKKSYDPQKKCLRPVSSIPAKSIPFFIIPRPTSRTLYFSFKVPTFLVAKTNHVNNEFDPFPIFSNSVFVNPYSSSSRLVPYQLHAKRRKLEEQVSVGNNCSVSIEV